MSWLRIAMRSYLLIIVRLSVPGMVEGMEAIADGLKDNIPIQELL